MVVVVSEALAIDASFVCGCAFSVVVTRCGALGANDVCGCALLCGVLFISVAFEANLYVCEYLLCNKCFVYFCVKECKSVVEYVFGRVDVCA